MDVRMDDRPSQSEEAASGVARFLLPFVAEFDESPERGAHRGDGLRTDSRDQRLFHGRDAIAGGRSRGTAAIGEHQSVRTGERALTGQVAPRHETVEQPILR